MSGPPCDHFGSVRWPRVSDLACAACGLQDEGLIAALGIAAPLSPEEWGAIREGITAEEWATIQAELPAAVAQSRASSFLENARAMPDEFLSRLTPAGVRWASFALAAPPIGPKLNAAIKRARVRTREALEALNALEKLMNRAWDLSETDVPWVEDPAAPTASFEAEKALLSSVGYLLMQRHRAAFIEGMASKTPGELRPPSAGRFLLGVFVPVSPRDRRGSLIGAARCLANLYRVVLDQQLGKTGSDPVDTAKSMIAKERRAFYEAWEKFVRGADSSEEPPEPLDRAGVIAVREIAGAARSAMERKGEDLSAPAIAQP